MWKTTLPDPGSLSLCPSVVFGALPCSWRIVGVPLPGLPRWPSSDSLRSHTGMGVGALPTPSPSGALLARITRSGPSGLTRQRTGTGKAGGEADTSTDSSERKRCPPPSETLPRGVKLRWTQSTETTVNPEAPFWRFPAHPVEAVPNLEPLH